MPLAAKKPTSNNIFAFMLGRERELCEAELMAWFRHKKIKHQKIKLAENNNLLVELDENFDPQIANLELGGIIKIAKKILSESEPSAIANYLLAEIPTGKIIFSLHATDQKIG